MSDYNSTATSTIYVNGKPAEQELQKLKQRASDLRDAIASAAKAGEKADLKKLRNELKQANREIKQVEGAIHSCEVVMKRLDKATPKELNMALKQLKKELNDMERGSRAWDEQVKKIKRVKSEISRCNNELKEHESFLIRVKNTCNGWGMAVAAAAASMTGLTMTIRQAVQAYADMDQEMASVRKFTGMTDEQVKDLNEDLKQMDTRTGREELNKLAQDAGKLGKSSKEDVLGFVRAADQIDVALDELGDGATLTLSKIAGVFGEEQRYGTEQALLKVGSVINDLSQNCRASAPFIAEFVQRISGAGNTADMTIPQLMAFGAVLDSNGAQLESSATALGQIIIKLYRDPAKYAEAAGMDVKKFTELLKTDANEALLTFLQTLKDAGNLDVLAPMLAEMGEKGSRSVQTLTMLAGKIDEVRAQQVAANAAFEDGTSVTKEFNVQNNTVQADLEKAKNRFHEMAVELGEKLMPVARYAISGTSALMKVMSMTIDFVLRYKGSIISLVSVILSYKAALVISTLHTKLSALEITRHTLATKASAIASKALTLAQTLGAAAVALLSGNVRKATINFRLFSAAIKANPLGLLLSAITAVISAITIWNEKTKAAREEQKRLREEAEAAKVSISSVMSKIGEETSQVKRLKDAIDAENVGSKARNSLIQEFNNKFGSYNSKLLTEKSSALEVAAAYAEVVRNLRNKLLLEGKQADLQKTVTPRYGWEASRLYEFGENKDVKSFGLNSAWLKSVADEEYAKGNTDFSSLSTAVIRRYSRITYNQLPKNNSQAASDEWNRRQNSGQSSIEKYLRQYISTRHYENKVNNKWAPYTSEMDAAISAGLNDTPTKVGGGGGGGSSSKNTGKNHHTGNGNSSRSEDRFAVEKTERKFAQDNARVEWALGLIGDSEYKHRLHEIDEAYYQAIMGSSKATPAEQREAEANYYEEQKKNLDLYAQEDLEDFEREYKESIATAMQNYIDGKATLEQYNKEIEDLELEHLRKAIEKHEEGSKERLAAEEAYQHKLFEVEKDRQEKQSAAMEETYKKYYEQQQKLKELRLEYFGMSDEEKQQAYDTAVATLDAIYQQELKKVGDNNKKKLELERKYRKALENIRKGIFDDDKSDSSGNKNWEQWTANWLDKAFGEGTWEKYGELVKSGLSSIGNMYKGLTSLVEAEEQKKLQAMTKKYDAEIKAAEGNQYRINQINKRKAAEEKRIKDAANKRAMAMEMAQAIASTALAAINAYKTAPAPVMIFGPIAAGLALAAGAVQIAAIKKQHDAQSEGYSEGGFTKPGAKNEPAGVVHAGEWVASQRLLASPVARPMINMLDHAQRTNTIGRLGGAMGAAAPVVVTESETLRSVIKQLTDRLNEPFVTINTVTGPHGIEQAQNDYKKLMNNTLPKNKRK